jgi:hypothetical protein
MFSRSVQITIIIAGLLLISSPVFSQTDIPVRDDKVWSPVGELVHRLDLGFGIGIDYGGLLGIQFGAAPVKHLTIFAAGGYYILGFGWQLGLKGLIFPKTSRYSVRPFLKCMYGTHSIILVDGTSEYDKIYKGFTPGFGAEFRFGKQKKNGFDVELNFPLRSPEYWDDYYAMKHDPRLEVSQEPIPVTFSMGFHHEF